MFFRKNTSMNKLSAFTPAPLLALGPVGCGEASAGGVFLKMRAVAPEILLI